MVYRYEWTWDWHAWQRLFAIDKSKLVTEMEKKLREKVAQQSGVTKVESVTTTITKEWNEYVYGIYHNHINGTTKTTFQSTVAPEKRSPIAPIVVAVVIVAVCAVLVAIFVYLSIQSIGSTIKEVPEIVPVVGALGLGALALIGVGLYLYATRKKKGET